MLLRFPTAHVKAHFRDHGLRDLYVDAVDLGQIHPGDAIQMSPQVKARLVRARPFPTPRGLRYGLAERVDFGLHAAQMFVDALVTGMNLVLIGVIEIQTLLQHE